jgi:hypothetical protein
MAVRTSNANDLSVRSDFAKELIVAPHLSFSMDIIANIGECRRQRCYVVHTLYATAKELSAGLQNSLLMFVKSNQPVL